MSDTKPKLFRIGIDARFYGPIGKGLGRYTQEIIDNILNIDTNNEYVIFLRKNNFNEFVCDGKRVKKVMADLRWYSLPEQLFFPFYILLERLDLMHFPHFNVPIFCPTKFIVTIHDLILINFPTKRATTLGPILYWVKNHVYKFVIWLAIKRSKKIIAVSNFTKADIINHFHTRPEKIVVTYEGVANLSKNRATLFDSNLLKGDDEIKILNRYHINRPYLLYVGNAYPHKNLEGLIKVFTEIIKTNHNLQLILAGKEDYFYQRLIDQCMKNKLWETGKTSPIIFTGYIADAELEILFKNALAYIFPSFYEGFGLPPLEAMAKGLPVISSNKASMPEILGDAAAYFNPKNEGEMKHTIINTINDKTLLEDLTNKGYKQIKKYSWWECARLTLEAYKSIL